MSDNPFVTIDFESINAQKYVHQGYNIVAIDVLRATSTIIVALSQGAKEVIPCIDIEETKSYKDSLNALTIGERFGKKLAEFDFTNSPFDFSKENLTDKIIAITSTTGTPLIAESLGAPHILIGSTLNVKAVARKMQDLGGKWAVLGAGDPQEFLEDQVGCAMIAKHYMDLTKADTDDASQKIIDIYAINEKDHILNSAGIPLLLQLGRKCDIDFIIAESNKYLIAPVVRVKKTGKSNRLSITEN